jgi:Sulfotransferase family
MVHVDGVVSSALADMSDPSTAAEFRVRDGSLTAIVVRLMSGRVGSTLLMQLLATSDEVVLDRVYPFENAFLAYFSHITRQLGRPYFPARDPSIHTLVKAFNSDMSTLGGPLPFETRIVDLAGLERRALRRLWDAFAEAATVAAGRPVHYYAEKLLVDARPIVEAGIPVVLIDLVRDPRDVLASIYAFNAARGFVSFGRAPGQSDKAFLEVFIANTKSLMNAMNRPIHGVQPIFVRYEDMVGDLPGLASRIGPQLGLRLDPGQVDSARDNYRHHMTSDGGPNSVGRWRADLRRWEVARIERELGSVMARLGYVS